jgi:hypothetical protein
MCPDGGAPESGAPYRIKIIHVRLLILAWYARLNQKAEDENDDEDEDDWGGRKEAGKATQ